MTHINRPEVLESDTVRIETPDGTMYVTVVEQHHKPVEVHLMIGKSGYSVRAWAEAVSRIINLALSLGARPEKIIEELSGITTDKIRITSTTTIRSGPEGLALGMIKWLQKDEVNHEAKLKIETILRKNKQ